jgi:creatinine amidohydrolase/Fe(II)-dependent formamide hydrolase-like protein
MVVDRQERELRKAMDAARQKYVRLSEPCDRLLEEANTLPHGSQQMVEILTAVHGLEPQVADALRHYREAVERWTAWKTCFTFAQMARTHYQLGEPGKAEGDVATAEKGYSTLLRFLTDPKHTEHLATEVQQELRAGLDRLRETLDGLKPERTCR